MDTLLRPRTDQDDRPPRGAKRFVNRIREIIDEHYERGLGPAGVVAEVKAALREMDRRNPGERSGGRRP
jgi:hypothetical protein